MKYLYLLLLFFSSQVSTATADLFSFKWRFVEDDPFIGGYVDTTEDALFITAFEDRVIGNDSRIDSLIPDFSQTSVFPNNAWKLSAYTEDGKRYDLPDNWDGSVGDQWGFVSEITVSEMPYINGTSPGFRSFDIYSGFGGHKLVLKSNKQPPSAGGNTVSLTSDTENGTFSGIPLHPEGWSFAGGFVEIARIPEPSSMVLLGVALVCAGRWRCRDRLAY